MLLAIRPHAWGETGRSHEHYRCAPGARISPRSRLNCPTSLGRDRRGGSPPVGLALTVHPHSCAGNGATIFMASASGARNSGPHPRRAAAQASPSGGFAPPAGSDPSSGRRTPHGPRTAARSWRSLRSAAEAHRASEAAVNHRLRGPARVREAPRHRLEDPRSVLFTHDIRPLIGEQLVGRGGQVFRIRRDNAVAGGEISLLGRDSVSVADSDSPDARCLPRQPRFSC